jgi:predicted nucleic acid-binding protein
MTLVICDSSSLILIAKIESLDMFIDIFEEILIPEAVFFEVVTKGKEYKKLDAFLVEKRIEEGKIKVVKIDNMIDKVKIMNNFNIHEGEAEAIIIYLEKKADLLSTDDNKTIRVCKILLYNKKRISKEKSLLKINTLEKIGWYKKEVINYFIEKIEIKGDI